LEGSERWSPGRKDEDVVVARASVSLVFGMFWFEGWKKWNQGDEVV
jgi:hypothetical protein